MKIVIEHNGEKKGVGVIIPHKMESELHHILFDEFETYIPQAIAAYIECYLHHKQKTSNAKCEIKDDITNVQFVSDLFKNNNS